MSLAIVNIHGDIEGDYNIIKDIPVSPTNGDMLMAVFPDLKHEVIYYDGMPTFVRIYIEVTLSYVDIPYNIWNAKYERKR